MKRLILIRFAQCGYEERDGRIGSYLTEAGVRQMGRIFNCLIHIVDSASISIISSTSNRSRRCAEFLGAKFGIDYQPHSELLSSESSPYNASETLKVIKMHEHADTLIVIIGKDHAENFPAYFAENYLHKKDALRAHSICPGCAWIIDCQKPSIHSAP
jgi:phosphohistidine phosphatase SixA